MQVSLGEVVDFAAQTVGLVDQHAYDDAIEENDEVSHGYPNPFPTSATSQVQKLMMHQE